MVLKKFLAALSLLALLAACDSPEEKAEAHYERGLELMAAGDEDRARVEFRNALKEMSNHLDARLTLARLNVKSGAMRPAFRDYSRIIEQEPDHLEANTVLGQIAFLSRNWDAFETHSATAIRLAPEDPQVRVLDLAGRYRDAVENEDAPARTALVAEAEALREEVPDSDLLRQILIDGYLADDRFNDALAELDKAIAAKPDNLDLYGFKVRILAQLQDEEGIETELRRMVEIFPEEESVRGNLLQFLVSRGDIDAAEEFLRDRAANAAPEDRETTTAALVQFLMTVRDRDSALAELEKSIAEQPDAHLLRALQASLTFDDGRRDAAIADMQALVEELETAGEDAAPDGQMQNIKVTLANMLSQNGNEVGARRLVEEILTEESDVVGALKMRARWLIADDDPDGAVTAMRTALASSPQDIEAMTIMAEAYQRAGNTDLMLNFLSLAVEASNNAPGPSLRYAAALRADDKLQQAEATLISSLRIQPGNVDVLAALGQVYLGLGDTGRARQVASTLKRIETPAAQTAATSIEVELLSRESGDAEVLNYLESLSESDDENTNVKLALMRARLQNGETEAALALADELVQDNPDNAAYAYFRALTLASSGDYDAARDAFAALVGKFPDAQQAWVQLARLQTLNSTPEEVLATLDRGLEASPDSPDIQWAKASYLQEQNDIEGAIAIYEDLYEANSGSVVIANNLASLMATFRSDDESLERARTIARRLKGTDIPAFQDTYGWILYRTGDPQAALDYLEPAAAALPGDASVQYHLGVVYEALDRPEEALAQMRRAMDTIGPLGTGVLTEEIRARIDALETPAEDVAEDAAEN